MTINLPCRTVRFLHVRGRLPVTTLQTKMLNHCRCCQPPAFLAEHNVVKAIRRANSLHMQRAGHPAVLSTRFDPASVSGGGAAFEEAPVRLNALDFHPSLGPSGYESSSVPESRDLPPRFVAGQEFSSVLQITKRPKLRAKDVAHRQSLTTGDFPTTEPHFWNLDSSFYASIWS